jgi:5'-3' exonuclease
MRVSSVNLTTSRGKDTGGFFAAIKSIRSVLYQFKPNKAFVVFDSGISKRRRSLYPPYKGARYRDKDDPFYLEMDEELREYLTKFMGQRVLLQKMAPLLALNQVRLRGDQGRWEADDVIKGLCDYLEGIIYVVSDDKDMLQLVSESEGKSVRNYRPIADQLVTADSFQDIEGYPQEEYFLRKCILGDKSDNIPNVVGVGKKTVDEVFAQGCPNDCYPFDAFFKWCGQSLSKRVRKIAEGRPAVLTNYELINIQREDTSSLIPVFDVIVNQRHGVDIVTVKRYFEALELYSLVQDLPSWIIPFQRLR